MLLVPGLGNAAVRKEPEPPVKPVIVAVVEATVLVPLTLYVTV